MTRLLLVRTSAERPPGERSVGVIDELAPAELIARIFAHDSVAVWGEPPARVLDLFGEVCPFTFVRTKLALEELPEGARLLVRVDHEPAVKNVPRSATEWGQRVLGVAPSGPGRWDIWIERRGDR
jgi:tRNA 2-thiouridine synthesizing protein A